MKTCKISLNYMLSILSLFLIVSSFNVSAQDNEALLAETIGLGIVKALEPASNWLEENVGMNDLSLIEKITVYDSAASANPSRLGIALAKLKRTGSGQTYGTSEENGLYEYGVSIRPDNSALVVARRFQNGYGFETYLAAIINPAENFSYVNNPDNISLAEFGITSRMSRLPRDTVDAGTSSGSIQVQSSPQYSNRNYTSNPRIGNYNPGYNTVQDQQEALKASQQQWYEQDQANRREAEEQARRQQESDSIQQANEQSERMVEEWRQQEAINTQKRLNE